MSILILKPSRREGAYSEAAEVFAKLCKEITGTALPVSETDDGVSDLVVIGSDGVNDFLMREVLELRIKHLGIRYGTDDYCIRTYKSNGRRVLVLAGGRGRSTLYAVYDYFERFCDCHYFWDGDVIPKRDRLPLDGIRVTEAPRFFYRGLRYFAHRGLTRFQAEHWCFEDWKRELDWLVKKRLNFFMLRIGMDDVWQRAFPEDVAYPAGFGTVTGKDADAFNDRTDFWTAEYRGKLRERVLEYARKLDLMYPTDCGTMTHWYSRTPKEFLENKKPQFITQEIKQYTETDTGKVFDFTKKENMDLYMRLTDTMVNCYEKSTSLFHTIGLGERRMFENKDKNFALKLVAYRRIAENIKRKYPDSKLLLASWDFCGFWTSEETAALIDELDPESTVLLDYTSDMNDEKHGFLSWNVVGRFPYIFGIFHAYESESELRGPYDRIDSRLKIAASDPFCKGLVLWPELSHSDPLMLEYLSQNSWSPLKHTVYELADTFCRNRYGKHFDTMNKCWQNILPFVMLGDWGGEGHSRPEEKSCTALCRSWYIHTDLWTRLCEFLDSPDCKRSDIADYFLLKEAKSKELSDRIVTALTALTEEPSALKDPFVLRDGVDILRTVLGRFLNFSVIHSVLERKNKAILRNLKTEYLEMLDIMSELLRLNNDFSVFASLNELKRKAPTNPDFELTLKRNICNDYCTQAASELLDFVFIPEGEAVFQRLLDTRDGSPVCFDDIKERIRTGFLNTPLSEMQKQNTSDPYDVFCRATEFLKKILCNQ